VYCPTCGKGLAACAECQQRAALNNLYGFRQGYFGPSYAASEAYRQAQQQATKEQRDLVEAVAKKQAEDLKRQWVVTVEERDRRGNRKVRDMMVVTDKMTVISGALQALDTDASGRFVRAHRIWAAGHWLEARKATGGEVLRT
jgi:hypothetical protein